MLRYLTAGESHGRALTGIVEGAPAGLPLTHATFDRQLSRRWLGFGRGGRSKFEKDRVQILSGVRFGKTIGSPITLLLENDAFEKDKAGWPKVMSVENPTEPISRITLPRPGHADLVGVQKYRFDDIRPVIERASARETAIRVACCTVARTILKSCGIEVGSHVLSIGQIGVSYRQRLVEKREELTRAGAEQISKVADSSSVRMLEEGATTEAVETIKLAKKEGDSLGGGYEVVVTGMIAGLGSYVQWDRRLDAQLSHAILSVQGQKAVEIGDGIAASEMKGSAVHDPIFADSGRFLRRTNRAGGVEGGVSTGMPVIVRGYMKPIPTLIKPLETTDLETLETQPTRYERSDVTSVPAASTVAESVVAFVIANALIEKFGADTMDELRERFDAEKLRQGITV